MTVCDRDPFVPARKRQKLVWLPAARKGEPLAFAWLSSLAAVGVSPNTSNSVIPAPAMSMVPMMMAVPTIRWWSDYDGPTDRVGRRDDNRRRQIDTSGWCHHDARRTGRWRRCHHHRGQTNNRQADGDAHAPTRPGGTGECESNTDCHQTDQCFRFHSWWFDGRSGGTFSPGALIDFGDASLISMKSWSSQNPGGFG